MAVIKTGLATVGSNIQPIGTWSATRRHSLGLIVHRPADDDGGPQTFMYVKYVKGSGGDLYQGSPVGFTTECDNSADERYVVSNDLSAVSGDTLVGVAWNTSTTAVTTTYFGWIQLARQGEVLKSVPCKTAQAVDEPLYWGSDSYLMSAATRSQADLFGVIVSGTGSDPSEDSLSVYGRYDVLVMNPPLPPKLDVS